MPKGQGNIGKGPAKKGGHKGDDDDKVKAVVMAIGMVTKVITEEPNTSTYLYLERLVLHINSTG